MQMGVIEAKLKELDDERKELAEYTRLDKTRRCGGAGEGGGGRRRDTHCIQCERVQLGERVLPPNAAAHATFPSPPLPPLPSLSAGALNTALLTVTWSLRAPTSRA